MNSVKVSFNGHIFGAVGCVEESNIAIIINPSYFLEIRIQYLRMEKSYPQYHPQPKRNGIQTKVFNIL